MRFIREHFSIILRLFIYQIGMTFFGVVLSFATAGIESFPLFLLSSIFSILFYIALVYNMMWEEGAKDIIRIDAGRAPKIRGYAARVSLAASIPNFALAFLMLLGFFFGYVLRIEWMKLLYGIMHMIIGFFEGMYLGLFKSVDDVVIQAMAGATESARDLASYGVSTLLYILSSFPIVLTSIFAYHLGMKNIRLFGKNLAKPSK